jgi:hypothetical protein
MKKLFFLLISFLVCFTQNIQSQCLGCTQPLSGSWQSVDPPTFRFVAVVGPSYTCGGIVFCINRGSVCPPMFPMTCNWQNFLFDLHDTCYTVPNALWSQFTIDTQYHWLSKVMNNGASQWCNCVGPIIRLYAALPPVNLTYPLNNSNVSLTPLLKWDTIPIATSYRIRIYSTQGLSVIVLDTLLTLDSLRVPAGKLIQSATYWWSAKAYKSGGQGPFADIFKFLTYPLGIKQLTDNIPESFALFQNYPNPFNPVTKIKFDIPHSFLERAGVRLIIYDILGREITTLVNEYLQPGTYEAEFDGTNYPTGVYYYTINAGSFSQSKKMVMIK